jgi:uncharacterized protein
MSIKIHNSTNVQDLFVTKNTLWSRFRLVSEVRVTEGWNFLKCPHNVQIGEEKAMRVTTPCVGLCSTTYGDPVCRGCKRFAHEIVDWNRYAEPQKAAVIARLAALQAQVVLRYFDCVDVRLLEHALVSAGYRYRLDQPETSWVYDLMRQSQGRLVYWAELGLRRTPEAEGMDGPTLWASMHLEYLALSEAHYERYFVQPLSFEE